MGTTRGYQRRVEFGGSAGVDRGEVGPGGVAGQAGQGQDPLQHVGRLDPAGPAERTPPAATSCSSAARNSRLACSVERLES